MLSRLDLCSVLGFTCIQFTFLYDGEGQLDIAFECGNHQIESSPFVLSCPKPSFDGGGIQVRISASTKGNHLRNLRIISPDMEGGQSYLANYLTKPFTPPCEFRPTTRTVPSIHCAGLQCARHD